MAVSNWQITDFSDENSSVRVSSIALTSANFDAQVTQQIALDNAIEDLSIGLVTRRTLTQVQLDTPGLPSNPFAQREMKWLVTYASDVTGKRYTMEIPAPDLTDNLNGNSDDADLTSDDWAAFVTAFETFARAPDAITENVSVISARVVGRNI